MDTHIPFIALDRKYTPVVVAKDTLAHTIIQITPTFAILNTCKIMTNNAKKHPTRHHI